METKILVTGASGFIGSFIVEEALRRGMQVWAGVRKSSSRAFLSDERIHFLELDFSSEERLAEQLRGHEFHFSEDAVEGKRPLRFEKLRTGERYEAGASRGNVLGSYLHLHFAGCPEAAAHFVEACTSWAR